MCNVAIYVCVRKRNPEKWKDPVCFFKQWHDHHFLKFILQEKKRQIVFHDMEKISL